MRVWAWALAFGLCPAAAYAAQDQDTFQVTASVAAACEVTATGPLAFGAYNPLSATPLTGSTDVEVFCTNGTEYDLALDEGVGVGATVAARSMARIGGGGDLTYALFTDNTYASVWGETVDTDTVPGTGDGDIQTYTIYGRAPIGQGSTPGNYEDTITVTVIY